MDIDRVVEQVHRYILKVLFSLCATGSAGHSLSDLSVGGLNRSSVEFVCTGTESRLGDCMNSSLASCDGQSVAAVSCQGNILFSPCSRFELCDDLCRTLQ